MGITCSVNYINKDTYIEEYSGSIFIDKFIFDLNLGIGRADAILSDVTIPYLSFTENLTQFNLFLNLLMVEFNLDYSQILKFSNKTEMNGDIFKGIYSLNNWNYEISYSSSANEITYKSRQSSRLTFSELMKYNNFFNSFSSEISRF